MPKVDTWMPFYVGDYLRDTMHLSTTEHGAYLLLIMAYWMKGGPLPNDDAKLAQIAQRSLSDWSAMRATLAEFFTVTDVWSHKRIEAELKKAADYSEAKRQAGLKGNLKRWGPSHSDRTAMPVRVANGSQSISQTDPPSPSPSPMGGLIPTDAPSHPPEPGARAITPTPQNAGFKKPDGAGVGGRNPWPTVKEVLAERDRLVADAPDIAQEMPGAITAKLCRFVNMGPMAERATNRRDLTPEKFCQAYQQALLDFDTGSVKDPIAILTTRMQLKPPKSEELKRRAKK